MYVNEDYNKDVEAILNRAKELEKKWVAEAPAIRKNIVEQFKSPIRPHQPMWGGSPPADTVVPEYPPCPRCASEDFERKRILDGVRHNGDGYGAIYEICSNCGYTVFWMYDDA